MAGLELSRRTLARPPWLGDGTSPSQGDLHILFGAGVPDRFIGRMFRLDDELTTIRTMRGPALRFGTTG